MRPDLPLPFLNIGPGEAIFLLLLVIVLFGAHKIPELARSLGKAQREFQRARDEAGDAKPAAPETEDERIRKAARDLGLPTEGKTTEELRAAIATRLQAPPGASP